MKKQKYPKCPPANYPTISLQNEEQGVTVLDLIVSTDGRVEDAKLDKTSGWPRLDEATIMQVKKCEFEKIADNGQPIRYRTKFQFHWLLTTM